MNNRPTAEIPCINPLCDNTSKVGEALADAKQHCGECDPDEEPFWISDEEIEDLNIATVSVICGEIAELKGWREDDRDIGKFLSWTHRELSEVFDLWQKGFDLNDISVKERKPTGIPIELADTIIMILEFCDRKDIDIMKAIKWKLSYNLNRKQKHGGKRI